MARLDGDLDPETGQVLLAALRAPTPAELTFGGAEHRTAPQRRADALAGICRSYLERTGRGRVGGERPHLTVLVDLEVLERRA